MRQNKKSIARRLDLANTILTTTSNNREIQELVAARGYSDVVLAEGRQLYHDAQQAVHEQAALAGASQRATRRTALAEQEARTAYQDLVKTVRAIFPRDTPERVELDVDGSMPKDSVQFVATAMTLFNNAPRIERVTNAVAQYGYHQTALEHGRSLIETYQQALQEQVSAKRAAVRATTRQHTALTALQQWTSRYVTVARIALRGRPDLLHSLGLQQKRARKPAGIRL
jgi:hypothetical protein